MAAPQSTDETSEEPYTQPEGGLRRRSGGRPSTNIDDRSGLESRVVDAASALTAAEENWQAVADHISEVNDEIDANSRQLYGWYSGDPFAEPAHLVGDEDRKLVSDHLSTFRTQCTTMAAVIDATLTEELKGCMRAIPLYSKAKEYGRVDVMMNCIMTMIGNSSYANSEPNAMNVPILADLEELGKMRQGSKELNAFIEEFTVCVTRLAEKGYDTQHETNDVMFGIMLIRACSNASNQKGRDDATDDRELQFPTCTKAWAEDKLRTWADRAKEVARSRNFSGGVVNAQVRAAPAVSKKTKKKANAQASSSQDSSNSGKKFCDLHKQCDHYTAACPELSQEYKDKAKATWEALRAEKQKQSK